MLPIIRYSRISRLMRLEMDVLATCHDDLGAKHLTIERAKPM